MLDQPLVSVVINCFNGEKYLRQAIDSVINQTYKNWELIFWDNQSKDDTAKIFKSYKNPKLKYFYSSEHTTLYKARNLAMKNCKGEFISFLDSDDWWVPEKLEKQIKLFDKQDVGLVYSNYYIYDEDSQKKKLAFNNLPSGLVTNSLIKDYKVGIITVIIRKKILNNSNEGFNDKYNIIGDFDYVLRLSKLNKFDCVQEGLAYWRAHKDNNRYVNYELEIKELEFWLENQNVFEKDKIDEIVKIIKLKITYMETINNILKGELKFALKNIIYYPLGIDKLKLIAAFLIPKKLLRKIKKRDY